MSLRNFQADFLETIRDRATKIRDLAAVPLKPTEYLTPIVGPRLDCQPRPTDQLPTPPPPPPPDQTWM